MHCLIIVKVRGVQHSDGEGTEPKDGNINTQQQPSGGAVEQATNDTEASSDEPQTEETDPSKLKWEMIGDNKDKKPNKKVAAPFPRPQKSHRTRISLRPKLPEKGTLIQDKLLEQFISEAKNMSQRVDKVIAAWEGNGSASLGKKTATNLEIMQDDIQEKLSDINETWADMKNNDDGNKTTRSVLSRAVRGVAKTTDWAFHQIDQFQLE